MFVSFFPSPRTFFWSAAIWGAICIAGWYLGGDTLGARFGIPIDGAVPVGVSRFWHPAFLWFYTYYAAATLIFAVAWERIGPHPWAPWSVLGSALIIFVTYFQVQVSVAINDWYGPFYDLIQAAVSRSRPVTIGEFNAGLGVFLRIALVYTMVSVLYRFFVSHWVFRWRQAMNGYYMDHWPILRSVEGAAQRVQDDTMRFADMTEDLGVSLIQSIMTLIAFFPVLIALERGLTNVPFLRDVPHPLVVAAVVWSLFGTGLLALVGIKLPGLEFRNQRVEAQLRKELVYGEDDPNRATPPTIRSLFANVRRNYFRLYFHYAYFNVARYFYLQTDNIFGYIILGPSIVAGAITLGLMTQIQNALDQVRGAFQYLITSWTDIVKMISIYKRLRAFEARIWGEELPILDQEYLEGTDPDRVAPAP